MYPPSGEYFGLPSYAKLPAVIFRGRASGVASDNSHRSLFVELAGCESWFDTKHNSELSGANAYWTGPPSWNGGESKVPGVVYGNKAPATLISLEPKALLSDDVHLNDHGCFVMAEIV